MLVRLPIVVGLKRASSSVYPNQLFPHLITFQGKLWYLAEPFYCAQWGMSIQINKGLYFV